MESRREHHSFHVAVFHILRTILGPFLRWMYCFRGIPVPRVEGNYIVVANHVSVADPILICLGFRRQMYLVASEHLMQKGFGSFLLRWLFDPIVRPKSSSAVQTVKEMLSCLKAGCNVCLFPEGTCTFSGVTGDFLGTVGKLVKHAKTTLITYRFHGGYIALPRWGMFLRRGQFVGETVGIYPPGMIANMSDGGVNACIQKDLYEDAYMRQAEDPRRYRSRRPAEALETAFYICPHCGAWGKISTQGETVLCQGCGSAGRMNAYGFLEGWPFTTLKDWDAWQLGQVSSWVGEGTFSLEDTHIQLTEVGTSHRRMILYRGPIRMTEAGITAGQRLFQLSSIRNMDIIRRNLLVFTDNDGCRYQISGSARFCGRKYLQTYLAWRKKA